MSKNSSSAMQWAVRLLDQIVEHDSKKPHDLPGSALRAIKEARRIMLADIRKRRDAREREVKPSQMDEREFRRQYQCVPYHE